MCLNISRARDFLKVLNLQRLHTNTYTQVQVWEGCTETSTVNSLHIGTSFLNSNLVIFTKDN